MCVCVHRGKGMSRMRRKAQGAVQQICANKGHFSSVLPTFLFNSPQPLTSHQLKPKPVLSVQALSEGTEACSEKPRCWDKWRRNFLKLLQKGQLIFNLDIANENCLSRLITTTDYYYCLSRDYYKVLSLALC